MKPNHSNLFFLIVIVLYSHDTDAGKYETLTNLHCSGTKCLFTSWLLVFWHEERETQFLLFWLFLHCPQSTLQLDWPGLAQSQISTNCFFKITKFSAPRFLAWRHSHPSPFPIWGFYYDICDCHILCAWAVLNVCTCTKPNSSKPNHTEW